MNILVAASERLWLIESAARRRLCMPESPHWSQLCDMAKSVVERTLAQLPPELREPAQELPVTYLNRPDRALRRGGIAGDTLGLFVGASLAEPGSGDPMPPQIILFLENLWEMAEGDVDFYREEVRTTLLHELGHYLGLDELDLEDRGLE